MRPQKRTEKRQAVQKLLRRDFFALVVKNKGEEEVRCEKGEENSPFERTTRRRRGTAGGGRRRGERKIFAAGIFMTESGKGRS